ncbi:type I-G CRISPR-associated protein Csb2 [Thioalkalivibrio thiocyanodenitrificans]|uniref:type I-G CRISPR-associated protein Csb2 n=1 Tax=Thioalkalivibrio thiocyanodenitrificans TaxID=243063 RepID=UPI00038060A2|nr:type I-U CRISPR-associated protein Csb2 [Thioalkalivibrio thiocyanodenitrificans]
MLALSFTFPAGRYHATPWDRHVNEGAVAWPPEPWRILRGLIATWHHKVKHSGKHGESTLLGLIESLAQELPEYALPAASHSHTRHYMPQFAAGKTSLVFDAFTAVNRDEPLTVVWPNVELPDDQRELLDELLSVMGYLGRAESWVEAKRLTEAPVINCTPGTPELDTETGELKGEMVTLYAPLPPAEYQSQRQGFLADKRSAKKLAGTLPDKLLDALSLDTADLRKQGWNQPPAARKTSYLRPIDALRPRYATPHIEVPDATSASFILVGKPLPKVEDALRIGELMRMAVMSQAKRACGEDKVPAIFSGHDMPEGNRHRHAFYLPWDSNRDGHIDRVLLHVPDGMRPEAQRIVEGVRKLWSRDGGEWRLVIESIGRPEIASVLTQPSEVWESITPYLHPWHVKKRLDIPAQIKRECRERDLPEPIILEPFNEVGVGKNRKRRPIHFRRFRSRRGLTQPDRLGSFWRLTFPEPVQGPLALGFACHFGLGVFVPCSTVTDRAV